MFKRIVLVSGLLLIPAFVSASDVFYFQGLQDGTIVPAFYAGDMFVNDNGNVAQVQEPGYGLTMLSFDYNKYPPELLSQVPAKLSSIDVRLRKFPGGQDFPVQMTVLCNEHGEDEDFFLANLTSLNSVSQDQLSDSFQEFSFQFNIDPNNGPVCDLTKKFILFFLGGMKNVEAAGTDSNTVPWLGAGQFNLSFIYPNYAMWFRMHYVTDNQKVPILVVPGVLGTDIYQGTNLLWANPKMSFISDGFMDPLAFNQNLTPLNASLTLGSVIRQKGAIGFISHYTDGLINQLTSPDIGYTEGKDLFTFPYDWRFGVSEDTVNQLKGEIAYIASTTGSSVVNVVAHSTGGLLVKKYVRENPTDHHIGKAVLVGVPNLGAPQALKALVVGDDFGVPELNPLEMKKIGQNMPVIYDLAPTQEYYNQAGSFFHLHNPLTNPILDKDLNFTETMQNLVGASYANNQGVASSTDLHTADFDNYDLRNAGVDLYNIVGCKSGTLGKFTEWINENSAPTFNFPKVTSGDGTVPFASADSLPVDETRTFFAPGINHGNLLSADGSRQEIVNILTGGALDTSGKILTQGEVANKPDLCEIKGESLKIHSPLAIDVVDQDGNHSGLLPDGSIENSIPGADYEVWGDEKYVFLPTDNNQNYDINIAGTAAGTFTLDDESISGNVTTQTQVFSNLPVTPALTGQVNLGGDNGQTTLTLQATPTSTPVVVTPDSTINADQSQDLTPPVSTSTIIGTMGQPGFYRSNVSVALAAQDPIVDNNASTTSGILKTQYSLDGGVWQTLTPPPSLPLEGGGMGTVSVTSEGLHTISFFSTDKAGNNEQPQTTNFTIDKTAPEAVIQFNPSLKDIQFTGSDNISTTSKVTVLDNVNDILLTDQAGNNTEIKLKEKNRKISMQSTIQSLSYSGILQDISKNILAFVWAYDKNNNLTFLSQNVAAKKTYVILAVYNGKKTSLVGIDKTGVILKSITGLDLLKVSTNKGDLAWSY